MNKHVKQPGLEGIEEIDSWQDEWGDMPEYVQERIMPFDEIIVRFKTEQDKVDFFKLLNQVVPGRLQSIWYPKTQKNEAAPQDYVDEP